MPKQAYPICSCKCGCPSKTAAPLEKQCQDCKHGEHYRGRRKRRGVVLIQPVLFNQQEVKVVR